MPTIRAVASPDLVTKADRFFRNDDPGVFAELIQNSRRAGASLVDIHIEQVPGDNTESRITVHDDGHGIAEFQSLLNFGGGSGWDPQTKRAEDPAGMGFFSLCHSNVEVTSGDTSVLLTPESFLGGVDVELVPVSEFVKGTRIIFTRPSKEDQLVSAAMQAGEFCPVEVYVNGALVERHDFLEGALYREMIDGVEVGFATSFRWHSSIYNQNWNFYGLQIREPFGSIEGRLQFYERRGWHSETIEARFNVFHTGMVKLQLPDRRGIVQGAQFSEFLSKARAAAYRYFQAQPQHALPFANWTEAQKLGIQLPEASALLVTWHASPLDDGLSSFFEESETRLLETVTDVVLVSDVIENRHSLEAALESTATFDRQLYQEAATFQGYSWYDALPLLRDTEVRVDGTPYEVWQPRLLPRPQAMEIALTITQLGEPDSELCLPVMIHVVDEDGLTFEDGDLKFVAIQNSPWDNDKLDGPFDVVDFLISATFSASDNMDADSWETQRDSYQEDAEREVNEYFRGPRAALLALLGEALSWEARRYAKLIGVREIHFRERDPEHSGWDVELILKQDPPIPA